MKALTIALIAVGLPTAVLADDQPREADDRSNRGTQVSFDSLDRNKDQQISKSEASADASFAARFASADVNGNGYINRGEYNAGMKMTKDRSSPEPQRN